MRFNVYREEVYDSKNHHVKHGYGIYDANFNRAANLFFTDRNDAHAYAKHLETRASANRPLVSLLP